DLDEYVFGAIRAGARGYLLKGAPGEEIARAVRTIYRDGSYLDPRIAAKVVAEVRAPRRSSGQLSPRELEVLKLIAEGLSNKEIGRALSITERTAKFHVGSIFVKLGADNRAQAVSLAT